MDNDDGILAENYFPARVLWRIQDYATILIEKREFLQRQVNQLEEAGCIWGNIVKEYRTVKGKEYGPYYRLTGYKDDNGHKPKPQYIAASDVKATRQKIDNHEQREKLLVEIQKINFDLIHARRHVESLDRFLVGCVVQAEHLVIPGLAGIEAGDTKRSE